MKPIPDWACGYVNRRVLVTGGLGFIGSALVIRLAELGAKVTVVDSLIPGHGGLLANVRPVEDRIRVNISDLRDAQALQVLVRDQDFIFHLAGQVSHGDSMRDPELDLGVNCVSTLNLVEACRSFNPAARLIYTSTRQVYGVPQRLPVDEDHPTQPVDVNGINKLAGEYYHLLYDRTYDLRSVVLRLTNTYGPRQQIRNNRQGFIGIFIRQALRGERIQVFGSGLQVRDFNYVDDVVDALLRGGGTEVCYGSIFNLGAPKRHTLLEFMEILKRHTGALYDCVPFPSDRKLIDIGDYYGSYARFKAATGWEPSVDLDEGIARTVAFYRNNWQEYGA